MLNLDRSLSLESPAFEGKPSKRVGHSKGCLMPIKVLKNEGTELRLRIIGENHSTLQLFRSRLNDSKDVDYANYFQKHPDLDEPELYVRCVKGKKAEKVFRDLCSDINKELSNLEL